MDAAAQISFRRELRRGEVLRFFGSLLPCLDGMEACASRDEDHGVVPDRCELEKAVCNPRCGPITASAVATGVAGASLFESGRQFASLTPARIRAAAMSARRAPASWAEGYLRTCVIYPWSDVSAVVRPRR